jgi:predicted transcriptional regulator
LHAADSFLVRPGQARSGRGIDAALDCNEGRKSWHIKKALGDSLALQAWQVDYIREGREDARATRVIPHD